MIDIDWPLDREELAHENDFDFLGKPPNGWLSEEWPRTNTSGDLRKHEDDILDEEVEHTRWNLRGHEDDILDEEGPHLRCWHCGADLIVNPGVLVLVSKKDAGSTITPLYYCRDCYEVRGDRIKAATVADFMI